MIQSDLTRTNTSIVTVEVARGHSLTYVTDAIFRQSLNAPTSLFVNLSSFVNQVTCRMAELHTCMLTDGDKDRMLMAEVFQT